MIDVLSERSTSSFPVSIGTGIALEALFTPTTERYDPPPPEPIKLNLANYDLFSVNVHTLLRNLIGSVDSSKVLKIGSKSLTEYVLREMDVVRSLFESSSSNVVPSFYMPTYNEAYKKQNSVNVKMRTDTTPKQITITSLINAVGKNLTADKRDLGIKFIDSELKYEKKQRCLLMTHIPHDLLSYGNFESLSLLESHTGKMKERIDWNTKYVPVSQSNMSILPFSRKLLCIFGDKYMYQPIDLGFRRSILDVGVKCKWNPTTSERKISEDYSREVKERMLVDVFRKI